ncbi:MAG TPA: MJ0042-type zinc finger domain-containing protein [Devosia sp.]|nr:MJ0042-type zinc finger domain-containing protein [Devosia sp.]
MSSPDLQTAVIACPHCGTRYQVPRATLGASGREVQCAQCGQSWHAAAEERESDAMFSHEDEDRLDAVFEAEARASAPPPPMRDPEHERTLAEIRAAIAPKPKPELPPKPAAPAAGITQAFDKRLERIRRSLPFSRLRRLARILSFVGLALLIVVAVFGRIELVRAFPALAGLYAGIGLGVNVVGLEFGDTKTLMSLRDGRNVMQVTAKIRSVSAGTVPVPPVLVTLLGEDETVLFEWTVTPKAREMNPGEVLEFSTEISSPPEGAARVRLSFANVRGDAAKKDS